MSQKVTDAKRGIADLRISYVPENQFDLTALPTKDPMALFKIWFQEARECQNITEPNAMTIATVNKEGIPSARLVLLKGFDETCFKFFTNYNSRKGRDIAENSNVALLLYWEALHKQVRIEGTAEKLPEAESAEYFYSRPHDSQLGACVSHQSKPIESHEVLLSRWEELKKEFPDEKHPVTKPDEWGGYRIVPRAVEFWQGQASRLHKRLLFTQQVPDDVDQKLVKKGDKGWSYYLISS